jgi:hypothetical protein
MTRTEPSASAATLDAPREFLYSPVSLFWHGFTSFISNHLPGDVSSAEPSFFNDLRIAFNLSHPNVGTKIDPTKTCQLDKREYLYPRDQQVLKTKCRVQSTLPDEEWNNGIPNYTPTGADGRPLPTQTIGDGHGGYGQEIIAVTSMCGNIPPGAAGKRLCPINPTPCLHPCSPLVTTNTSTGPNGQFTWLTCGINAQNNSTGWEPPCATVEQVITFQGGLRAAVAAANSPYQPCSKYVDLFETAGEEFQSESIIT